ncbi:MAG: phosphoribosylaminoimidazolesuccinocarboxamide synthase [FCB group bacterium]|nr:phosphoribosylaminoimidazolesuccinocarboxamide synthase [FCB group bacterium]
MERLELLHEGKAKRVFKTDNPRYLLMEFKDDISAFDGDKKSEFTRKGEFNNRMSAHLFEYLESYHVPTHFVQSVSATEMLVKNLEMIPIEMVMRNISTGSLVKRYGYKDGVELTYPVMEQFLKDDSRHDPMINETHAYAFGLCTPDQMRTMQRITSKVNAVLRSFFDRRGLILVDFKLEFGHAEGDIFLADEISGDSCRIWDKKTGKKLDKDRFRNDLGDVENAYEELMNRVLGAGISGTSA